MTVPPLPLSRNIPALIAMIDARAEWGHRWVRGRDCVSFALRCVEAQTGVDLLAGIPTWSNRREALDVTRGLGGLVAALDDRMAMAAPALAQRGDVAGLPDKAFGVRLMVVEGATLVGPGQGRLERLPRSAMMCAWSASTAGFGMAGIGA